MHKGFLRTAFLILIGLQFGCFNPHHVFDMLKNRNEPVTASSQGLIFYDWWRTQPGALIVNSSRGTCVAIHMMGYKMGEWPGQFCLLFPDGNTFSAAPTPTLKDSNSKIIWSLDKVSGVSDAYWDETRGWIWLLTKNSNNQRIIGVNIKDSQMHFEWTYTGESPLISLSAQMLRDTVIAYNAQSVIAVDIETQKLISTLPIKQPIPTQVLNNSNIFYRQDGFNEYSAGGRLVWQWKSDELTQNVWGRKVVGLQTEDFLNVFRKNPVKN